MSETQRKAVYAAAAAILAALGAFGIVDAAHTDQILGIVSGALTLAMAVVPILAHRKVGAAGLGGGDSTKTVDPLVDPGLPEASSASGLDDPGLPDEATEDEVIPRRAEDDTATASA